MQDSPPWRAAIVSTAPSRAANRIPPPTRFLAERRSPRSGATNGSAGSQITGSGGASPEGVAQLTSRLDLALERHRGHQAIRVRRGRPFAVRGLTSIWPELLTDVCRGSLLPLLRQLLGPECGAIQSRLFDKAAPWSVPWHRDVVFPTRMSQRQRLDDAVLESMLIARIHLDPSPARGALELAPRSHRDRPARATPPHPPRPVTRPNLNAGDVLLMQPLLLHRSRRPTASTRRRVIHLDLASRRGAPGLVWREFSPLGERR